MNQKDFFDEFGLVSLYERFIDGSEFTVNDLAQAIEDRIMEKEEEQYQRFKARLMDELKADVQGVYSQADLVEKE